jgi:methyltransferase (TIGR00027 family)
MNKSTNDFDLSGVEETAFLTVYAKAIESQSKDPILKDEKIEEMVKKLDPLLEKHPSAMAKKLIQRSLDPRITVHLPLRSKKYDDYALDFLDKHSDGVIINIGCGLDTRFFRIDNGQLHFFDLDLPEMIKLKKHLLLENDRYQMIGQSVLDFEWMDPIAELNRPALILAEGVLMYLPKEKVTELLLELQRRFPDSELVCELTNRTWVEGFWGKMASLKMKRRFKMREDAGFKFDHLR